MTSPYASDSKIATALTAIGSGSVGYGEFTLKQILVALGNGSGPTPPTGSYYRRPDGTSRYHRPDGTSFYLRP